MSNAALAFFTGLGSGYLQGKDDLDRKAREKKREQREDEDYEHQRQQRQRQQEVDAALRQAAAPMQAGAGGMSKPEWMDNRDVGLPENAALVNGGLEATATANTPQAVRARQVASLRGFDPERADRLEQSGKQAELTDLQLKTAKDQITRDEMFRETASLVARGGWAAIPKVYERYEDGNTAQVIPDGKGGATVVAIGKDGKEVGRQQFGDLQEFMLGALPQLDPKLWVSENRLSKQHKADAEHQAATLAETSRHNKAAEGLMGERNRIAASAENRAAAAAAPGAPAFDPLSGFDAKKAQAVAFEQASKEATEAAAMGKPMTAQQQAVRAQQIYQNTADAFATEAAGRERARVFREAARAATTPEEIEAVRQRAAKSGFKDDEMAALDPRFAKKKPAAAPAGASARKSAPAAAAGIVADPIGDQPIGMLTPQEDIEAAAAAGNPRAIAYLRRQQQGAVENLTAPRTAAAMLGM